MKPIRISDAMPLAPEPTRGSAVLGALAFVVILPWIMLRIAGYILLRDIRFVTSELRGLGETIEDVRRDRPAASRHRPF